MSRTIRFTLLLDQSEKELIAALAEAFQRSQSDTIRWVVREAAKEQGLVIRKEVARKNTNPK